MGHMFAPRAGRARARAMCASGAHSVAQQSCVKSHQQSKGGGEGEERQPFRLGGGSQKRAVKRTKAKGRNVCGPMGRPDAEQKRSVLGRARVWDARHGAKACVRVSEKVGRAAARPTTPPQKGGRKNRSCVSLAAGEEGGRRRRNMHACITHRDSGSSWQLLWGEGRCEVSSAAARGGRGRCPCRWAPPPRSAARPRRRRRRRTHSRTRRRRCRGAAAGGAAPAAR